MQHHQTPLHLAAATGDLALVTRLLDHQSEVDAEDRVSVNVYRWTSTPSELKGIETST